MTSDDLNHIQAAFERALELDGEALEVYLGELSSGDPEVASRVRDLLQADRRETRFGTAVAASAETTLRDAADPWIGKRIGPWRILQRIGTGGMGAVFIAERMDEAFEHRVAIKLMNTQLLAQDAIARFRAERQILANLNHPYIAQLHDGGATDDGVPYLVMEHVEGMPIDQHCDQHALGIVERLELFRKVCAAVDYAHRRLVVHRDLKPGNILVDVRGNPKLLDFGIAKLLDSQAANLTIAVTRQGARAMTPEYASPEQVRGEPASVATDVYSLGVLLYRMLTGASPYGTDPTSTHDYERAILNEEPRRPSTVFTPRREASQADTPGAAAVRKFRSRLSGDLDNIVLRALQKDPERRYTTAREFADDIGRYLDHRPVLARPDSLMYRLRKFARRNNVAVAASALAGVALVSFLVVTLLQNQRIAEERDSANRVADFLIETYTRARPEESPGETVTAKQVLDSGYERVDEELDDEPRIKARLLWVMGESYASLGLHQDSVRLLRQSIELGRRGYLADDDLVDVLANLGQELSYLGEFDEAGAIIDEAQSRFEELSAPDPALAKVMYMHRANHLRRTGRMSEGLPLLFRAEEAARRIENDVDGQHPDAMHSLGAWHLLLGDLDEAEKWLRRALDHEHPRYRTRSNTRAVTLGVMGSVLRQQGRLDEALQSAGEALDILRQEVGPDHINVAVTLSNMAMMYFEKENLDEAERLAQESFDILVAKLGPDHSRVGISYGVRANIREAQGRYDEALALLEQSLQTKLKSLPRQHPSVALTYRKMGVIRRKLDDYRGSLADIRTALGIVMETSGEGSQDIAQARTELGITLYAMGDLDEAERYLRMALAAHTDSGSGHWLARTSHYLGAALTSRGNCSDARPYLQSALENYRSMGSGIRNEADAVMRLLGECPDQGSAAASGY